MTARAPCGANKRKNSRITTIYRPKSQKLKNHFIYKAIIIYNTLPIEIKSKDPKKFNRYIKPLIRKTYSPDKVP